MAQGGVGDQYRSAAMKWLNLVLRWLLGGFFVYAGVAKIIDPAGFAKNIANYQMLPHDYVNLLAITLPWIEVVPGLLLMAGIWRRPSALAIAGMLVVFIIAIGSALSRGLNINCGCTGTVGGATIGLTKIAENIGWFAMAIWLIWKERD
ncbi:MAG: hypothetical protein PCFJNLEI_03548 [Verrucomicrobiae bacterium]|nr:hypothetical protein [Verrucomicrobiae bacterium]